MDEIEERIRQKAGNATMPRPGVPTVAPSGRERKPAPVSGAVFGSGMTEEEVRRIISQFRIK